MDRGESRGQKMKLTMTEEKVEKKSPRSDDQD